MNNCDEEFSRKSGETVLTFKASVTLTFELVTPKSIEVIY
jgi:hypothetical protein